MSDQNQNNQPGGQPGTGQPGGSTNNPGTDGTPQYVTREDFGKTAALISGLQKTIKDLSAGLLTPDKLVEFGLLEKDDAGAFKPRGAKPPEGQQQQQRQQQQRDENDPVVQRLKSLEKQLADERRAKEELTQKQAENERRAAVIDALTKAGAVNPGRDYVHIASKFAKGDDGNYLTKGRDQYGNEVDVPLADFAEKWLKENPELLKQQTQSGSGTPQGGRGQGMGAGKTASGATVIPSAQWRDMKFFMANKAKFDSGEYVRGAN